MAKPFFSGALKTFLIICNFIAAICFVIGSYVKFLNPEKWWFIGLLTLSLPYILIILLIFFFWWLFGKKIWMLISLSAIAFCFNAVQNFFPLRFSAAFKEKKINSFRVMDWNVKYFNILEYKTHPERKEQMMSLIKDYQPDIACIQEMVGGDDDKAINYLGDFKRTLQFSNYYYSYENAYNFDPVHHFGIIIFSKYPVINKKTISSPPHDYNSIFQYVDIVVNTDTLRIFNIHLQSLSLSTDNLKYIDNPIKNKDTVFAESKSIMSKLKKGFVKRWVQANRVKEEIDKSPYPIIVCGDFNDVPNSYAYSKIGDGLQNAFVKKGAGFGRTYSGISPTLRIDNIFVDKKFTVEQFTRIPKKLSDHFPIIADISIKPSK
ncbi:MAG TPA: endonuclease/exonuclease/phosphatase family protein [Chitinophagaceae bacterium]|nr:endonuclease/exonuclease/phosphatase family protein [Chitinophagaceae bacterium]